MKILILSTYPIETPRHGGQLRVRNLVNHYQEAGFSVEVAGVLGSDTYPVSKGFDTFPGSFALSSMMEHTFLMEDVAIGLLYASNDQYFSQLADRIENIPDIIQVEHPWLFGFAQRYIKERSEGGIKLLYSSHNIEYKLKASILSTYFLPEQVANSVALVKKMETQAVKDAEGTLCVSENDRGWVAQQTSCQTVLAPNGVSSWKASEEGIDEANYITQQQKFVLFCGSAHPPNTTGFFELLGEGFGSLSHGEALVIAGSVGTAIESDPRVLKSARLAEDIVIAGQVSDTCLSGLLETAHCIILPITQGGGTNLKTAEAIWTGCHIVATPIAMRGFEPFIGSIGIHVVDNTMAFKQKIRDVMRAPPLKIDKKERVRRRIVLWEACLQPLNTFITRLFV